MAKIKLCLRMSCRETSKISEQVICGSYDMILLSNNFRELSYLKFLFLLNAILLRLENHPALNLLLNVQHNMCTK